MSARHRIAAALLACALGLSAGGCGGGSGGGVVQPPPPQLAVSVTALGTAVQGQRYNQLLIATGGTAPYNWTLTSGSLPPGLELNSDGTISGTPTLGGQVTAFNFTVQVADSASHTASGQFSITAAGKLEFSANFSFPAGSVGFAYNANTPTHGGVPPFTFTLTGLLPPGISMNPQGVFTGTPTTVGNYNFSLVVQDSSLPQQSAFSFGYTIMIGTGLLISTPGQLPTGVQNAPYTTSLATAGGTAPFTWSLTPTSSPLPSGLNLDSATGRISGTPASNGVYSFGVQVTDSSQPPATNSKNFIIYINPPFAIVSTSPLSDAALGAPYLGGIEVDGGIVPYTLQVTGGGLPPGLAFLSTTTNNQFFAFTPAPPTALGTYNFTVQVSDSESPPATASRAYSLRVNPLLSVPSTTLPAGLVGQSYSFQFNATGGLLPLSWSIFPALPAGLSLDSSTGLYSGVPTVPFHAYLSLRVQDSSVPPQTVFITPSLHVAPVLNVGTLTLPPVVINRPVDMQLAALGGTGPFTWSIASGVLPSGLTMDASGRITGTVSAIGNSSFTVKITDPGPPAQTATGGLTFSVVNAPGRNDSIAAATPLSNGTYTASISPFADPPETPPAPDIDVYKLTANPGAVVRVETFAERLTPSSPLDTVIEMVDSDGNRLQTCALSPEGISMQCMNDDSQGSTDSLLFFQVPPSATSPMTFYVRVLDWRGDARPDLIYQISVSGAN